MTNFVVLVSEMREAQKKYFDTRTREALRHSKKLEKEVDKVIDEMVGPRQQSTLF